MYMINGAQSVLYGFSTVGITDVHRITDCATHYVSWGETASDVIGPAGRGFGQHGPLGI